MSSVSRIGLAVALFAPILLAQQPSPSASPENTIYIVKSFSCNKNNSYMQTGFSVAGLHGVITALHGVAGCAQLEAEIGAKTYKSLILSQVDVKNDVALLTSPELANVVALGVSGVAPFKSQPVVVQGHPHGIELVDSSMTLHQVPITQLGSAVPSDIRKLLSSRGSPDPQIKVLHLAGSIVSGDSGAPVLDIAGNVLGVADGGLDSGVSGLNWAIIFSNIRLGPSAGNRDLQKLATADPSNLFAMDTSPSPRFPLESEQEDTGGDLGEGHAMRTKITLSRTGDLNAVVDLENTNWFNSFCGTIAVWLTDGRKNIVWQGGPSDEQWCVSSKVAIWKDSRIRKTWHNYVPITQLSEVRAVAIVQATGEKKPYVYLRENIRAAEAVLKTAPAQ